MGGWGWNLSYKKVSDPRSACHCIKYSSHSLSFGGSLGTLGLVKQEWRGQEAPFHLLNQLGSEWRLQRASGWLDSLRGRSVKKLQEDLMLFKSAKTKIHLIMLLEGCGVQWPVTHFDLRKNKNPRSRMGVDHFTMNIACWEVFPCMQRYREIHSQVLENRLTTSLSILCVCSFVSLIWSLLN